MAKLQTEPWANPEGLPADAAAAVSRTRSLVRMPAAKPAEVVDPSVSLLDRHETKFPLGGVTPAPEADPAATVESEKIVPEEPPQPDKVPHSEKKPLP